MRITAALFLIILSFSLCPAMAEELRLEPGGQKSIELPRAPRTVTLSNPNVLDAERVGLSNTLRLMAKGRGRSQVTIEYPEGKESTYSVTIGSGEEALPGLGLVSQAAGMRVARELQKIPGIESFVENGRVHVCGTAGSLDGFRTIVRTVMRSPETFFPSFTLAPDIERTALQSLNKDLTLLGESHITVTGSGGVIFLTGVASGPTGRSQVLRYIRAVFPGAQDALSSVNGGAELTQVELKFLDVAQGSLNRFGFRLSGITDSAGATATFAPGALQPTFQVAPLSALFQALKETNAAREIASPVIVTRNGERATFLAGGEIPIVSGSNISSNENAGSDRVVFKPYGVSFAATPTLQSDGALWLALEVEFSSLDDSRSFGGVPAFLTRKIQTQVIVRRDEAVLLTGLIHSRDAKHVEKFPILGSIPILGEFFKSRRLEDTNSEVWVAVSARSGAPDATRLEETSIKAAEKTKPSLLD